MNLSWKVINNVSLNVQMDMKLKKVNAYKEHQEVIQEAEIIQEVMTITQIKQA